MCMLPGHTCYSLPTLETSGRTYLCNLKPTPPPPPPPAQKGRIEPRTCKALVRCSYFYRTTAATLRRGATLATKPATNRTYCTCSHSGMTSSMNTAVSTSPLPSPWTHTPHSNHTPAPSLACQGQWNAAVKTAETKTPVCE